jgi:surface polysaccharide O-acyltransferase-like enzyme
LQEDFKKMTKISMYLGLILMALGIIGYAATSGASITALIPSFFGILFYLLGRIGQTSEKARKHTMHAAALLALVGFIGSFRGLMKVFTLIGGGAVERPEAIIAQSIMAVLCAVFLILAIRSFITARRSSDKSKVAA